MWPNATTWFVYALALFFAVTWLARRIPTPVLLGGAALLSVVAARVDSGSVPIDKMGTYYVFFAAAVRLGGVTAALPLDAIGPRLLRAVAGTSEAAEGR